MVFIVDLFRVPLVVCGSEPELPRYAEESHLACQNVCQSGSSVSMLRWANGLWRVRMFRLRRDAGVVQVNRAALAVDLGNTFRLSRKTVQTARE